MELDLLVTAAVGGPGRRGARLGVHGNRAAPGTVLAAELLKAIRGGVVFRDPKDPG